jgi:hypothetical protein
MPITLNGWIRFSNNNPGEMRRKKLVIILPLFINLFLSCDHMKDINFQWEQIINSADGAEEAGNITTLCNYLKKNDISFRTFVFDHAGKDYDYNTFTGNIDEIAEVKMEFYVKDKTYKPVKPWKPRKIQNLFLFFRE